MTCKIDIKPITVNQCWQGRRFKTDVYKGYEKELLYRLPKAKMPLPPFKVEYEFGVSYIGSDWDNPVKPLQDILVKKYGFSDAHIFEANVKKIKVEKGGEYFIFRIESIKTA